MNRLLYSVIVCLSLSVCAYCEGMELTLAYPQGGNSTPEGLKRAKELGVTSMQTYVHWNEVEVAPAQYEWSYYDEVYSTLRAAGLKWVPFIIAGPHYVTPEFVREDPDITFLRCLEHSREDLIPSIWCPKFPEYIDGWLAAFAEHYADRSAIESIMLGITGGYGEAVFPADIGFAPSSMHMHIGMWCGDKYAVKDFREHCRKSYRDDIEALNSDWGTYYPDFEALRPFTRDYAPSPKAWLFLVAWYRDAMTRHADWWLETARRHFGDTRLYLCTGGNMIVEHGSDFSAQAKVAAKHGAGLRVTNEGSHFPKNVFLTRLVQSACRHYGAFSGTEPAREFSPLGSMGRLFNVYSGGSTQLFTHFIRQGREEELFHKCRPFISTAEPRYEFGVLYPVSTHVVEPHFYTTVDRTFFYRVRELIDYGFVDERMAEEGALEQYDVLLVYETGIAPAAVLARIGDWVSSGGILISVNSRVSDYDGRTAEWDTVGGLTEASDVVGGGPSMELLEPEILPSFVGQQCEPRNGVSFLASDCTVLLKMGGDNVGRLAWMRQVGNGWFFGFHGPGNTDESPGLPHKGGYEPPPPECETEKPVSYPVMFLRDILRHLALHPGVFGVELPSLWLGDEPVFLSETDKGLVALNVGDSEAMLTRNGKAFEISPQSITLLRGE